MTGERVVVMADVFPARVTVASTSYANVRAVVADGELQVYRLGASGPEIVYQRAVEGVIEGALSSGLEIPTTDGLVWVEYDGSCGCGSALKVADLFPGRQRVMTGIR